MHSSHLTDRDLLMAADGELSPRRRDEVQTHLDACWTCRERMSTLEATIHGLVRARNQELDARVPPAAGPRALLCAEMAGRLASGPRPAWRFLPASRLLPATAAGLVALTMVFQFTVTAEGAKPRAGLTPGEVRPITLADVCRASDAVVVRHDIPDEVQQRVFAAYGIPSPRPGQFEVDYLITPDLGGSDSIRNLWPQPYSVRWNARVKDRLEQKLHQMVCGGQLDLSTAQREIASDWIGAYKKYVGETAKP